MDRIKTYTKQINDIVNEVEERIQRKDSLIERLRNEIEEKDKEIKELKTKYNNVYNTVKKLDSIKDRIHTDNSKQLLKNLISKLRTEMMSIKIEERIYYYEIYRNIEISI